MSESQPRRLGDLAEVTFGYAFPSAQFADRPVGPRLLRGENIGFGTTRWTATKWWSAELANGLDKLALRPGDIVLAMDRPWLAAGLKHAVIRADDLPALLVQRVARLRARERLDQRYLRFVIGSQDFAEYVLAVQTGSTIPHISGRQITDYRLPRLPPLAEQRVIGEVLGGLEDKIGLNTGVVAASRDLAIWELRGSRPDEVIRIGDIAEIRRGIAYTSTGLGSGGVPMVNLANADNYGWLKRAGLKPYSGSYKDRHVARPGALLVTGVEQTWSNEILGWPMLVPIDLGLALFSQDLFLIDFRPEFIWCRLPVWSALFEPVNRAFLEGHIYGSTVARIPREAFENLEVRVPRREDPAIELADTLLSRAWAAETETLALIELRNALLPELLSGRLQVPMAREHVEALE